MLSKVEVEELVHKVVARYNRFRAPEVFAKLVWVSPESITIAFSGNFCSSCGVLGYFEGFVHDFEALNSGLKLKIGNTREINSRSMEVDYKIKVR